jgi:serine O-acetyltransferase
MTLGELRELWRADLHRYGKGASATAGLRRFLQTPGFRYTFVMRLCAFTRGLPPPIRLMLGAPVRLWLRRLRYRFGIDVPASTRVGPGLYINHPGGIVVHSEAVIGRNCNLSHDVTVGEANRGPRKGFPVIGDAVFLGPGAKVIGRVHVGDDVAVGANAVVTSDVPDGSVVAGVPARVISHAGAAGYINNTYC